MGTKSIVVKIPSNVHVGFKLSCFIDGKTMSSVISQFCESYAKSKGVLEENGELNDPQSYIVGTE